ncbi:hypothetical protein HYALB_00000845 [Hymenoscyphus albidus]|uniref:RING-type domain-containing protein n=1 Tax=Hymenoscyphus albidus TaxID=595503 RepID=A0A9N9LFX4_9HELO|nr:hypothetical protein HYALB_00000845 [Hymenoscyphus albidus]
MCNQYIIKYICGHTYKLSRVCECSEANPKIETGDSKHPCGSPECLLSLDKTLLPPVNLSLFESREEALALASRIESRAEEFLKTPLTTPQKENWDSLSSDAKIFRETGGINRESSTYVRHALVALEVYFADNEIVPGKLVDLFGLLSRVAIHYEMFGLSNLVESNSRLPHVAKMVPLPEVDPSATCDICYNPFKGSQMIKDVKYNRATISYCNHTFCDACFSHVLFQPRPRCPMCRTSWEQDVCIWPMVRLRDPQLAIFEQALAKLVSE